MSTELYSEIDEVLENGSYLLLLYLATAAPMPSALSCPAAGR